MSKLLYKTEQVGDFASGTVDVIGHVICDTTYDLPTSTEFQTDGVTLQMGSTADIIQDGTRYKMDSSGTWVQQPSEFQLDLTSYYTSSQTDAAIAAALSGYTTFADVTSEITLALTDYYSPAVSPATISNGTDVFTLPPGVYAKATSVNTLVNMPSDFTGNYDAFYMIVRLAFTGNSWRRQIIIYPTSNSGSWATRLCYRNNETSTQGTFGSWVRFDGGTVL